MCILFFFTFYRIFSQYHAFEETFTLYAMIMRKQLTHFSLQYASPDFRIPFHPFERFRGQSASGIYGDVVTKPFHGYGSGSGR